MRNMERSWNLIVNDVEEGRLDMFILLYSLPDFIIEPMIRGCFPFSLYRDPQVWDFCSEELSCVARIGQKTYAGAYVQFLCQTTQEHGNTVTVLPVGSAAVDIMPNAGKFLNSVQVRSLADIVLAYGGNAAKDHAVARSVHSLIRLEPRSARAAAADGTWRLWQCTGWTVLGEKLKELYVNASEESKEVVHTRVPMEVGNTVNIARRLKEHRTTDSLCNPGLALFRTILGKHMIEPRPELEFALHGYALFYVWRYDEDLLNLSEAVGTLLLCSMFGDGGLNPKPPGTNKLDRANATVGPRSTCWANGEEKTFKCEARQIPRRIGSNEAIMDRRLTLYERHAHCAQDEARCDELEQQLGDVKEENRLLRQELQATKERIEELQAKLSEKQAARKPPLDLARLKQLRQALTGENQEFLQDLAKLTIE